jgi:hypothetical protein
MPAQLAAELVLIGSFKPDKAKQEGTPMTELVRAGVVRVGVVVGHVGRALFLDQRAAPDEQLHYPGDDLVQHVLQRLIARRSHLDDDRFTVSAASVDAVQH